MSVIDKFEVTWTDRGRPPVEAPDPRYPNGIDIDCGQRPACKAALPYMTKTNIGLWSVMCRVCGATIVVTMASRHDDPRSVMVECRPMGNA